MVVIWQHAAFGARRLSVRIRAARLSERQSDGRRNLFRKQASLLMSMRRLTLFLPIGPWIRFAHLGAEKSPYRFNSYSLRCLRHSSNGKIPGFQPDDASSIPAWRTGDWCSGSARQPLKLTVAVRHRDPLLEDLMRWSVMVARLALNEPDGVQIPAPLWRDNPIGDGTCFENKRAKALRVRLLLSPLK